MPRRHLSIRMALVIRMAIVLLSAIGVGGAFTYWQVSSEADALGQRVVNQTSTLIDQRITSLLDNVESQARFLGKLTSPSATAAEDGPTSYTEFRSLGYEAQNLLIANPQCATATVVFEKDGQWLQASEQGSALPSVQYATSVGKNRWISSTFLSFSGNLTNSDKTVGWTVDLRKDPAYQECKQSLNPVWTGVRLVGGSALTGVGNPGVACYVPLLSQKNRFLGVVFITVSLENLNLYLLDTKVGENGFAFMVERGPQNRLRVVADAQPQNIIRRDSADLPTAEQLSDPVRRRLLELVEKTPYLESSEAVKFRFRADGRDYVGGAKAVTDKPGPQWVVCIVAPQEDFLASTRRTVLFFVTFGVLAVGVGTFFSLVFARRFAQPLQHLARETSKIRALELDESPLPQTRIREIDELSRSVESMKSGLRSMEKLVPTEYARHLIASGKEATLGGERRHITTYFGDIVGFTRLSHQLPPEELVVVLAEYLDVLSNEVETFGGTLDKFNGDDVMAFWGAPTLTSDHALMAVKSALASLQTLENLHSDWREQGRPVLSASFGIATGDVIVGNVGNQRRMNYTVIGDSVNLASRLQGLNKFYGTHILVSESTANECGDAIVVRPIDIVQVFNREEPVRIFQPIALTETASPADLNLASLHAEAFEAYEKRQFAKAAQVFESILALYPNDGPASILHARSLEFLKTPPPSSWKGATELGFK